MSLRPLSYVCAFVRHTDHPQLVTIQYSNGEHRSYTSTDRDSLIASFLDGVRGSGNRDVHVRMSMLQVRKLKEIYYFLKCKKTFTLLTTCFNFRLFKKHFVYKKEPVPILHLRSRYSLEPKAHIVF